jgi:TPR repeat protein
MKAGIFWYRKAAEQGNVNAQENLTTRGISWKDA